MVERRKVIINTDPGYDDAMALILATKCNALDILAITTTAGNSSVENTTRNARYVLDLLNRQDISLYSGASKPLVRELDTAKVTGSSGLEGIDPINDANLTGNAVDKIVDIIQQYPGGVTVVSLGPLTNIAQAFQKAPTIIHQIKEIVMMGGAIRVPGNKNRVAEFNIFVDPEAADLVFRSEVDKTLVPLDACNQVWMGMEHFNQIKNPSIREFLLKMARYYIKNISEKAGEKRALMYDPLTVYYLLNPDSCKINEHDILVETQGEITRGMTVSDLRGSARIRQNIRVVEEIDSQSFIADFIKIVGS